MRLGKTKIIGVTVRVSLGYPEDRKLSRDEFRYLNQFINLGAFFPNEDQWDFEYLNQENMDTLLEGDIQRVRKYLKTLKK